MLSPIIISILSNPSTRCSIFCVPNAFLTSSLVKGFPVGCTDNSPLNIIEDLRQDHKQFIHKISTITSKEHIMILKI